MANTGQTSSLTSVQPCDEMTAVIRAWLVGSRSMEGSRLGREYGKLWTASAVSTVGDGVTAVASPLLVASLTTAPLPVSGAVFAAMLPWLLFTLLSGALVDRLDRRRVMVVVDVVRAGAIGGLGLAVATHTVNLVLIYAVAFLLGTGETLFRSASTSILPAIVAPGQLERANGRLAAARMFFHDLLAGPLGGFLFALAAAAPFLLDAGSFVAGAVLLALLHGPFRATVPVGAGRAPADATTVPAAVTTVPAATTVAADAGAAPVRSTLFDEIREGVRWLAANRLLRTLAVLIGLLNITLTAAISILVLVATQRLGLGSIGYGLLFTAMAVGGLVGGLVGDRLIRRVTASVTLRVGLLVETATHLTIALSRSALVVGAAFLVFGVHASLWTIVSTSMSQRVTPKHMMGRVSSVYLFLAAGGNAFGALLGGVLATRFGLTAPYWVGFVVAAVVTAATWRVFDRATMAAVTAAPTSAPR
jgi:MFS family permease